MRSSIPGVLPCSKRQFFNYVRYALFLFAFQGTVSAAITIQTPFGNEELVATQINSVIAPTEGLALVVNALTNLPEPDVAQVLDVMAGEQYTTMFPSNQYVTRRFIHHVYDAASNAWRPCLAWSGCLQIDFWFQAGGGRDFLDGDHNAEGYKSDYWDASLGFQTLLTPCLLIGVAGNFAQDFLDFNQRGNTTWNNGQGAFYGVFRRGCFYVFADVMGGGGWARLKRPIEFDTLSLKARSNPLIRQGTFYGEIGFDYCFCEFLCQPFYAVEVGYYRSKAFRENNADVLNLIIHGKSTNTLNTSLGVHVTYDCDAILLRGDVAWVHYFHSLRSNVTNQFQSFGTPFLIRGSRQGDNGVWGVLNMSTSTADVFNLYAEVMGERWAHWSAYGFNFGFNLQY